MTTPMSLPTYYILPDADISKEKLDLFKGNNTKSRLCPEYKKNLNYGKTCQNENLTMTKQNLTATMKTNGNKLDIAQT